MSEIPMNERNIVYFPVQSVQIGTDENDNPIYDNAADAEILQNLRKMEIKDGVYPDDSTYLQVMSNNNMTVTVKAGYAHVRGVQVWVKEDVTLALAAADDLIDRVDRVVLRLSLQNRDVTLAVKTGDATLTRTEGQTWELGLADIAVDHLNDTITQAEITDLRLDTTACGVVSGLMQVDTQSIFNQYMAWWENQQDTSGYLTVADEYSGLDTTAKQIIAAINELEEELQDSTVKLSGNQSIGGVKTFSSFPVLPSINPTLDYQGAHKKYVDDNAHIKRGTIPTDYASLNAAVNQGMYYVNNVESAPDPIYKSGLLIVFRYSFYCFQIFVDYLGCSYYQRFSTDAGSSFSGWNSVGLNQGSEYFKNNDNANNAKSSGAYQCAGTTAANHFPYPYGVLEVITVRGGFILQRMTDFNGSAGEKRRTYNGTSWTEWA